MNHSDNNMHDTLDHLTTARNALRHILTERDRLEYMNTSLEQENAILRRELTLLNKSKQIYEERTNLMEKTIATLAEEAERSKKAYEERTNLMDQTNATLMDEAEMSRQSNDERIHLLEQTIATLAEEAERSKKVYNERNDLLEEEMRYSDALHDSLSDMKMTLRRVNDELLAERNSIAVLRREYQALQEKTRKESEQLRSDLGAMYRLRDEVRAERDKAIAERDEMQLEFKREFEDHTKTIQESGNLRNAMGRTVAKYNELRYNILPYLKSWDDDEKDSIS